LVIGDVSLFGVFLASLGVAEILAARLRASLSRPWRLEKALGAAAGEQARDGSGSLAAVLRNLDETGAAAALEEIWALAGVEPVGGRSAAEIVRRLTRRSAAGEAPRLNIEQRGRIERYLSISDEPAAALAAVADLAGGDAALDASLSAWERRLAALSDIPARQTRFATAFARGFGYYDGLLFEVRSRALGEDQPVAAGGRYDTLPARLGSPLATGAVGCMVRPGRAWKDGHA
jgi:ATP phosphoribosyltransferase regulatory subunit